MATTYDLGSVIGPKGDKGKSAYDAAKEAGYTGTEEKFNQSLADIPDKADKVTDATEGNLASLDANGNLQDSGQSAQTLTAGGKSIVPCESEYNAVDKVHVLTPVYENQSIPTSGMVPVTFIPDADFHAGDKLRFNGQDCDAAYSNTDLAVADGAFRAGFVTSVIFQFVETGGY